MHHPRSVTAAIVEQLAEAEGVDALDVSPLLESVDPDALETIFGDPGSADHVTIEFSHGGYHVTVDGGRVSVEDTADDL